MVPCFPNQSYLVRRQSRKLSKTSNGSAAMATLMLLGALFPLHIGRAWRAKKNRATSIVMLAFNAVLIATAFGHYYLVSETLRPRASGLHIA